MKKQVFAKQVLILCLLLGIMFTHEGVVYAANANDVDCYAYQNDNDIVASISGIGGKDCIIAIKYYDGNDTYLKTKAYYREQVDRFKIYDRIPWNADHAIVQFYLNEVEVGYRYIHLD
ncbi:hypothetical protein [Vallitalea guaymasensis]|uniref:Secreted protein n=1 Tax=Vallitalea guaymasensis TaxID=1185412 RepID=A0A8J8MF28_9FIRM|nr:hypothetical protein [Vallitalea guaymasensis]QUH31802.1 hypothetical protein HYG85_23850 [Vallitalea guaymasensis]